MMFGGWFSGGSSMAGMSGMMVNGGLAYADRWPPMVLPLGLYRAAEEVEKPCKTRKKETDPEEMAEQDQTQNQETTERRQAAWKERQRLVWTRWTN